MISADCPVIAVSVILNEKKFESVLKVLADLGVDTLDELPDLTDDAQWSELRTSLHDVKSCFAAIIKMWDAKQGVLRYADLDRFISLIILHAFEIL